MKFSRGRITKLGVFFSNKIKTLISKTGVVWLILCCLYAVHCYGQSISRNPELSQGKRIIVELSIEGFPGISKHEMPLAQGAGFGCGGAVTPQVKLTDFNCGMTLVRLQKSVGTISFHVTTHYVDGSEQKVEDRFLVKRGEKGWHKFADGISIRAYFSGERKGRKRFHPDPKKHLTRLSTGRSISELFIN